MTPVVPLRVKRRVKKEETRKSRWKEIGRERGESAQLHASQQSDDDEEEEEEEEGGKVSRHVWERKNP